MSITGFNRRRRLINQQSIKENMEYSKLKVEELRAIAKERGIEGYSDMKKAELIEYLK